MAKWNLKDKNDGEMIVTFGGDKWAQAKMAAMNVLRANGAEMDDASIVKAALNANLDEIFAGGIQELGLTPATMPEIEVRNVTTDSITVCFSFALKPEVKLGDISGLKYKVKDVNITDEDVERGVQSWLQQKAAGKNGSQGAVPELTDDYVKSLKLEGMRTVDEFRVYIRKLLAKTQRLLNEQEAEQTLIDGLLAVTETEIPARMVMSEVGSMLESLAGVLAQQGMTAADYLKSKNQSEEDLVKELWPSAKDKVKTSLALEAVADKYKLRPSNAEIEGEYKAMAMRYNIEADAVKQQIPADQLSYELMLKKALDYLKNQNKNQTRRGSSPIILG